jgi:iron complex transport system ATP-binding protein
VTADTTVVRLSGVGVRRSGSWLLGDIDLEVGEGERWVVMGPNGAGKTTLLLVASGRLFPTVGRVELLGEEYGAVDMAELRPRIGWASSAATGDIPRGERVHDVVMTGAWAVSGRWRESYDDSDADRASALLAAWGIAGLADRTFGTLSEGERKRTMIARSLMADPELLLLDEPGAGLDLGGREDLVARMAGLAADPAAPTQILVTHHVEEIPPGFTHVALLANGRIVAAGAIATTLTADALSQTFAMPIALSEAAGRYAARRATA